MLCEQCRNCRKNCIKKQQVKKVIVYGVWQDRCKHFEELRHLTIQVQAKSKLVGLNGITFEITGTEMIKNNDLIVQANIYKRGFIQTSVIISQLSEERLQKVLENYIKRYEKDYFAYKVKRLYDTSDASVKATLRKRYANIFKKYR